MGIVEGNLERIKRGKKKRWGKKEGKKEKMGKERGEKDIDREERRDGRKETRLGATVCVCGRGDNLRVNLWVF